MTNPHWIFTFGRYVALSKKKVFFLKKLTKRRKVQRALFFLLLERHLSLRKTMTTWSREAVPPFPTIKLIRNVEFQVAQQRIFTVRLDARITSHGKHDPTLPHRPCSGKVQPASSCRSIPSLPP
jgi:hypothetical protein